MIPNQNDIYIRQSDLRLWNLRKFWFLQNEENMRVIPLCFFYVWLNPFRRSSVRRKWHQSSCPLWYRSTSFSLLCNNCKHPIKYPFSLSCFHSTFACAILHELLTYFHYDKRTIYLFTGTASFKRSESSEISATWTCQLLHVQLLET